MKMGATNLGPCARVSFLSPLRAFVPSCLGLSDRA